MTGQPVPLLRAHAPFLVGNRFALTIEIGELLPPERGGTASSYLLPDPVSSERFLLETKRGFFYPDEVEVLGNQATVYFSRDKVASNDHLTFRVMVFAAAASTPVFAFPENGPFEIPTIGKAIDKHGGIREPVIGAYYAHFSTEEQRQAFLEETGLDAQTFQRGPDDYGVVLQRAR